MIEKIEELRKEHGVRKDDLCSCAGVTVAMYYRYMKGTCMSIEVCERMLDALGFKLKIESK